MSLFSTARFSAVRAVLASVPLALLFVVSGVQVAFADGAEVSFSPASLSVDPGGHFDVDVVLTSDQPTRGLQFGIRYDPKLVQVDATSDGSLYRDWAKAHGAQALTVIKFKPDNQTGQIALGGMALFGGGSDGPVGTGTVLHISGTALSHASGTSNFELEHVHVSGIAPNGIIATGVTPLSTGNALIGVGQAPNNQPQITPLEPQWHDPQPAVPAEVDLSGLDSGPLVKLWVLLGPLRSHVPLAIVILGLCAMVVVYRLVLAIPVKELRKLPEPPARSATDLADQT